MPPHYDIRPSRTNISLADFVSRIGNDSYIRQRSRDKHRAEDLQRLLSALPHEDKLAGYQAMIRSKAFTSLSDKMKRKTFIYGLKTLPDTHVVKGYDAMIEAESFKALGQNQRALTLTSGLGTLPKKDRLETYKTIINTNDFKNRLNDSNRGEALVRGLKNIYEQSRIDGYLAMIASDSFKSLGEHNRSKAFTEGLKLLSEYDRVEGYKAMITSGDFTCLSNKKRNTAFGIGLSVLSKSQNIILSIREGEIILHCSKSTVNPRYSLALKFDRANGSVDMIAENQTEWSHGIEQSQQKYPEQLTMMASAFKAAVKIAKNSVDADTFKVLQDAVDNMALTDQEVDDIIPSKLSDIEFHIIQPHPAIKPIL